MGNFTCTPLYACLNSVFVHMRFGVTWFPSFLFREETNANHEIIAAVEHLEIRELSMQSQSHSSLYKTSAFQGTKNSVGVNNYL